MINNETKESKLNQWKKLFYGCSSERYRINKILFCLKRRCFLWDRWNTLRKIGNFYIAFHIGSFWLNAAHCGMLRYVVAPYGSICLVVYWDLLWLIVVLCWSVWLILAQVGSFKIYSGYSYTLILTKTINLSLRIGCFPDDLIAAEVGPIFF